MSLLDKFEFEAPQYIDSWENATNINDGADNFFDALETLDNNDEAILEKTEEFTVSFYENSNMDLQAGNIQKTSPKSKIADEIENKHLSVNGDLENKLRKTSQKSKGTPLRDRNEHVPPIKDLSFSRKLRSKKAIQYLPTVAESPILRTKLRARPKTAPCEGIENKENGVVENESRRLSLKRKASSFNDQTESVPLVNEQQASRRSRPKEAIQYLPTIAESPVLLTKTRLRPRTAPSDEVENRVILKPKRKMKLGVCIKPLPKPPTIPEPFNLTESGKKVHSCLDTMPGSPMNKTPYKPRKIKRLEGSLNGSSSSNMSKIVSSAFSFYERDKEMLRRKLERFYKAREETPFVFKAQSVPKGNSSFLSNASSSKKNFFNTSTVSSISACDSRSMAFSFYERDQELLKRKKERMNQVEIPKCEFKAKEPTVLMKEPFFPEIKPRIISEGSAPDLATEERADKWKKIEMKKKEKEAEQKALWEEWKKAEQEEIRKFRKTLEFKATSITKK